ncbi:carbohydrate ABC transporter permease [Paenibacillus filicis]|uniref:Carbohydrate ABC transporter permease n=1 Tax=Paenibacillus gyeongsangnamensis TaxID=3388067 RepID=A0ABT4Q445_9BACL|nr:carbohydrate ABC transporter permease [Paenibacillus filicis]MCZ8511650.1 carbohydrate ABC transporter permease [Paenibacillus filicis]
MVISRKGRTIDDNPWWGQWTIYLLLIVAGLVTLLPIVNICAKSLSNSASIAKFPLMLLPHGLDFSAYHYILSTQVLLRSFGITVFATVVGTFLNLLFTVFSAYGLSKTYLPGHKYMLWFVIFPMLFGAGLIPHYILLKNLGLINNIWVLVINGLVSPFNLILMRNFFWNLPDGLEESATIDGANDLQTLWHIVLPLSKPAIATIGLFYAVHHWNDFFTGLYFINDNSKWPLQVILRSIVIDQTMMNMGNLTSQADEAALTISPENIKAATIMFSIVPIMLVYPFLQKYFVKGIYLGSVKG